MQLPSNSQWQEKYNIISNLIWMCLCYFIIKYREYLQLGKNHYNDYLIKSLFNNKYHACKITRGTAL